MARWLSNDIGIAKQMAGWSLNIPGHGATSGRPMIGIDNGQGRSHGSLYVTYADQAEQWDTDIWFYALPTGATHGPVR